MLIDALDATAFLVPSEVPANRKLKVGDRVRLTTLREFRRAGYRLGPEDAERAIPALVGQDQTMARNFLNASLSALNLTQRQPQWGYNLSAREERLLLAALRSRWLRERGMGGPERGVHVAALSGRFMGSVGVVERKACMVRIGVYSPGTPGGYWCPEDAEGPFLGSARNVVIRYINFGLSVGTAWVLSGDLEPEPMGAP